MTAPFTRYASHPIRLLSASLKAILLAHVFATYGYSLVPTSGASMLPTIEVVGDIVLIDKAYRRGRGVTVGDVVSFDSVVQPGERVIKRVLGLEGDFVGRDTPGLGRGVGEGEVVMVCFGFCFCFYFCSACSFYSLFSSSYTYFRHFIQKMITCRRKSLTNIQLDSKRPLLGSR